MDRRRFLAALCALPVTPAALALPAVPSPRTLLIQRSPLAGFQYHEGEALWRRLRVGQSITLAREPDNPRDPRAVRIEWRGRKLGYLPRVENSAVSQMMDRGERLAARIASLRKSPDPWQRIGLEVVAYV